MCIGLRIKSEQSVLCFLICPESAETAESSGEKQKGKTAQGFSAAAMVPEVIQKCLKNKKIQTRPSIISDRTPCQAEFSAALQDFHALPSLLFP